MARRLGRTKGVKIDGLDGLDSELDDEQKIANYYNVELERNQSDEELNEKTQSEKELSEEQLEGFETTCNLAEFKARGLGNHDLAERIRNKELNIKELQKFMDEEVKTPENLLPVEQAQGAEPTDSKDVSLLRSV